MLGSEKLYTLAQAPGLLPRVGTRKKRISACTLWRWATKGVRGCRLETLLLGGRYFTTAEALDRFGHAVAGTATARVPESPAAGTNEQQPRNPRIDAATRSRKASIERARRKLQAAGI